MCLCTISKQDDTFDNKTYYVVASAYQQFEAFALITYLNFMICLSGGTARIRLLRDILVTSQIAGTYKSRCLFLFILDGILHYTSSTLRPHTPVCWNFIYRGIPVYRYLP